MTWNTFFKTYWRDVLNVVGLSGTLISLWLTYRQSRKARTAAEAAEAAVRVAVFENREAFRRHSIAAAVRVLDEVKQHATMETWLALALRLGDLAGHLSQIRDRQGGAQALRIEARQWEATFRLTPTNRRTFSRAKWANFLARLQAMLDEMHGPFHDSEDSLP